MTTQLRVVIAFVEALAPWRRRRPAGDGGQGMIEYALLIGLIVLVLIVVYSQTTLGSAIEGIFADTTTELEATTS